MIGFPELVNSYPTNGQTDVLLNTDITLDWSVDVDLAQLNDANELSKRIILINEATNQVVPFTFETYSAQNKRVTLNITSGLASTTKYRLLVRAGFRDSNGRRTIQEYVVGFTTTTAAIYQATLVTPVDGTVFTTDPYTFTWTSPTPGSGAVSPGYDVNFYESGLLVGTFSTTSQYLTLSPGSYEPILGTILGRTFGWEVVSRTNVGVSGTPLYTSPSDRRSILFNLPSQRSDPATSSIYTYENLELPAPFTVLSVTPDNYATNIPALTTVSLLFAQSIATGTAANFLSITRKDQLPRNDNPNSYLTFNVSGSWVFSGQLATFTFAESFYTNTRYTVKALAGMQDINGQYLSETFESVFSSLYTPYYVDIQQIKSRLRSEAGTMPDDLINYYIYNSSLQANSLYQSYILALPVAGATTGSFPDSYVRDAITLKGYGVLRWVEASTLYEIYASILVDEIRNVGRKRRLADYEESLNDDFLAAIKMAQDKVRQEMEYWREYVTATGASGVYTQPNMADYDFDYNIGYDHTLDCSEKGRGWNF